MTERQLEILPGGTHLIANAGGVVVVVAHRADLPAGWQSSAGTAMTALLGLIREAEIKEKQRSGRVFARLATSWLMNLDNEDEIEFGVLTPSATGVAVFLHGGVTAVLTGADRAEVLRGRDAGFTVDRVVVPAPSVGIGIFVDQDGASAESLPGRGISALGAGMVPGAGAVLWSGEPTADPVRPPARKKAMLRKGGHAPASEQRRSPVPERELVDDGLRTVAAGAGPNLSKSGAAPKPGRSDSGSNPVESDSTPKSAVSGADPVASNSDAKSVEPRSGTNLVESGPESNPIQSSSESSPVRGGAESSPVQSSSESNRGQSTPDRNAIQSRPDRGQPSSGHPSIPPEFAHGSTPPDSGFAPDPVASGPTPGTEPRAPFAEDLEETVVPTVAIPAQPSTPRRPTAHQGPGAVVKGFKCSRHHLNDPRVSFCAVCGIRMDQLTCVLTDGIRPPLGLLLLDDGTSIVLDNDCVLGREPEHADAVKRGARPIRLSDSSGGMSRAHAEIRLVDWDVLVVDHGSANGTYIRPPGHQEWMPVIPRHPTVLAAGAQLLLGGRVLTFDSQHNQF